MIAKLLKNKKSGYFIGTGLYFLLLIPGVITNLSKSPFEILFIPVLMIISTVALFPILDLFSGWLETIKNNKYFQIVAQYQTVIIFSLSILLPVMVYIQVLKIHWGILDDHEIFYYLGSDNKLGFNELFPVLLEKTEVGQIGMVARFRPTYYFLRILQTVIMGDNVHLWYLSRLVIIAVSVFFIVDFLRKEIGLLNSGLIVAYIFTFSYLADIFANLGPSEAYAFLGLAFFGWAYYKILRMGNNTFLPWLVLCVGTVLCVGSKENLLILLIPLIYLMRYIKKWKWHSYLFYLISMIYSLYVVYGVVLALNVKKVDVYGRSISLGDRLLLFVDKLMSGNGSIVNGVENGVTLIVLFVAAGFVLYQLAKMKSVKIYPELKTLARCLGILLFILIFQQYFYNWIWPTGGRYDFPGMLYVPTAIIVLYLISLKSFNRFNVDLYSQNIFKGVFTFCLFLAILIKGYGPMFTVIQTNVAASSNFAGILNKVVKTSRNNPDSPLIIESYTIGDYESIFSYERYLYAKGITNPIYLRLHNYTPDSFYSDLTKELGNQLVGISKSGDNFLIRPMEELRTDSPNCISFYLSFDPADTDTPKCENSVKAK